MTNNLKDEIKRVVEDSDLLTRLNELADLLYENGDTRLSINTERGQWVWHNKDLTSLIEQEREKALREFAEWIDREEKRSYEDTIRLEQVYRFLKESEGK